MTTLFLIGRIIFGIYWLKNAYNHFKNHRSMAGYAGSVGVPHPTVAIIGSGILLLVGGLSMLTGYLPVIGVICLVVFLLGVTFKMHQFWKVTDPGMRMIQTINFDKNIALLGAVLMTLAIPMPWPFSL